MPGIIDGSAWLDNRLKALKARLEEDPGPDQVERVLIEAEIQHLEDERKSAKGRFRRWLLFGGRRLP